MANVRYFKLKNSGAFVVRIQVLASWTVRGNSYSETFEDSSYHDICVGGERTFDLYSTSVPDGATVQLNAYVVWGYDNKASDKFTFTDDAAGTASYEISGTTLNNHLKLISSN